MGNRCGLKKNQYLCARKTIQNQKNLNNIFNGNKN